MHVWDLDKSALPNDNSKIKDVNMYDIDEINFEKELEK